VLAEMLTNRGELAEADQQLRAAVALAPLDSRVLVALARSALLSGRLADAAHWATEAARLDPTRASIHRLLCQIHQRRGDQAKVDEELRILAKLTAPVAYYEWPDPFLAEVAQYKRDSASVLQMAQRLIEDGDAADAIARLQEAGGVRAADVRIAILLGKAYVHANDLRRAADTLQRARARDPRQAPVHFELGNLARTEHRLEEAAAHYAEAARLEPNYALAHYQLGLCRRELGDRDGAISAIEQACQCVPQSARVRHLLVQLLWESDRRQEATEHLQQAIRLAPNDPETRRLQDQMRQP
jgi:tetratricopeptide (TPR) repeat protein